MPRPPDDDAIGDVQSLFREDSPRREPSQKPRPAPDDGGGYDLIGGEPAPDVGESIPPAPIPPIPSSAPRTKARPRVEAEDAEADAEFGPDSAAEAVPARVDRVWSRGAEWGSTLVTLGIAGTIWLGLLYSALVGEWGSWFFLIGLVGLAALIVLAYPIIITLERPVRMTPEQAVRDYFGALAHLRPHYKRMWLILSSAGQDSQEFGNFGEFQAYWKRALARLRGGKAGGFAPLIFRVQDFRSEKSAGKTSIKVKFTLRVHLTKSPGGAADAPALASRETLDELSRGAELASYRMALGLVRGPDKMWYLNDGALPATGGA